MGFPKILGYLFIILFLALTLAEAIKLRRCPPGANGNSTGNNVVLDNVDLMGCEKEPCVYFPTDPLIFEANITLNFTSTGAFFSLLAVFPTGDTAVLLENKDICTRITYGSCKKIKPGTKIGFRRNDQVENKLPIFVGSFRSILKDDEGVIQYCGEAYVVIRQMDGGLSKLFAR